MPSGHTLHYTDDYPAAASRSVARSRSHNFILSRKSQPKQSSCCLDPQLKPDRKRPSHAPRACMYGRDTHTHSVTDMLDSCPWVIIRACLSCHCPMLAWKFTRRYTSAQTSSNSLSVCNTQGLATALKFPGKIVYICPKSYHLQVKHWSYLWPAIQCSTVQHAWVECVEVLYVQIIPTSTSTCILHLIQPV
jgi:hypothetical protein